MPLEEVAAPPALASWVAAALGAVLLLAGRRVFWLVLAVLGFLVGFHLARQGLNIEDPGMALALGLVAGLAGALLAVVVQKLAVVLAGLALGGAGAWWLADQWALASGARWLAVAVGVALGAALALWLFDAALVVLSAMAGAYLLVRAFEPAPLAASIALVILSLLGVAIQARGLLRSD